MSSSILSSTVIESLSRCDEAPPNAEYSPILYGEEIANGVVSEQDAIGIINGVLRELPSSLAASFLDGFLTRWNTETVRRSLVGLIVFVRELTGAASIVELLATKFSMSQEQILSVLSSQFHLANDSPSQERICLAVWAIVCGETYDCQEGRIVDKSVSHALPHVTDMLRRPALNAYCVSVLNQCRDSLDRAGRAG